MLTAQDIEFMKETRKEVVNNRQTLITIVYTGDEIIDDISGEIIGGEPESSEVMSVVTEISASTGGKIERLLIGGIEVETGDIWLSIDYDLVSDIEITEVIYNSEQYVVMASDRKGIGAINRIEVLGRVKT